MTLGKYILIIHVFFFFTTYSQVSCLDYINVNINKFKTSYLDKERLTNIELSEAYLRAKFPKFDTCYFLKENEIKLINRIKSVFDNTNYEKKNLLEFEQEVLEKIEDEVLVGIFTYAIAKSYQLNYEDEKAKEYLLKARDYFLNYSIHDWLVKTYANLSVVELRNFNTKEAKQYIKQAENYNINTKINPYVSLLIIKSKADFFEYRYKESLEKIQEANKLAKENNFIELEVMTLRNTANLYSRLLMEKEALKAFNNAIEKTKKVPFLNKLREKIILDKGSFYVGLRKLDSAKFYLASIETLQNENTDPISLMLYYDLLAKIAFLEGNNKEANLHLFKGLKEVKKIKNEYYQSSYLHTEALLSYSDRNIPKAKEKAKKALNFKKDKGLLCANFKLLSKIYGDKKKYDSAYKYQLKYVEIRNKIEQLKNERAISALELINKMLTEKKEKAELKHQLDIKDKEREVFILLSIVVGLMLLSIIVFFWLKGKNRSHLLSIKSKELKIQELKEEKYLIKLDNLTKELDSLNSILEKLKKSNGPHAKSISNKIIKEKNWTEFLIEFESLHHGFIKKLKEKAPDLTQNEIRFLALLKISVPNKEIAKLLNIEFDSVRKIRYRIKKKIKNNNLIDFI